MKKLMMTTAAMVLLGTGAAKAVDVMQAGVTNVFTPNEFVVTGVANGYTHIDGLDKVTFDAYLNYATGNTGRIKSWKMEPRLWLGSQQIDPFWLEDYSKGTSYPAFNRPKSIDIDTTMFVGMSVLKNFILNACNTRVQQLINGGMPAAEAYGKESVVPIRYALRAEVDATLSGDAETEGTPRFGPDIRCKPLAGHTGGIAQGPQHGQNNQEAGLSLPKTPSTVKSPGIKRPTVKPIQATPSTRFKAEPTRAGTARN